MIGLTVVIPAYNREDYLGQAIESCLKQTIPIEEIIVIDNQSEDSSFEIAKKYEVKHQNVRAVRNKENIGMVRNWNRGLGLASNEYVSILHSDDFLHTRWSENVRRAISSQKKDVAVFFGNAVKVVADKNTPRPVEVLRPFVGSQLLKPRQSVSRLWTRGYFNINNSGAIIYQKEIVSRLGLFNPESGFEADLEFHLRILNKSWSYFIDQDLVYYRIHEQQASYSREIDRNKLLSTIEVMDNSIRVQKRLLPTPNLISYYYSYILIYALKLLVTLKIDYAGRMLRLVDSYRLRSMLQIVVFLYHKVVRTRLGLGNRSAN